MDVGEQDGDLAASPKKISNLRHRDEVGNVRLASGGSACGYERTMYDQKARHHTHSEFGSIHVEFARAELGMWERTR